MKKGTVFIGTSGYNYPHWSGGVFYPKGLPQRAWLEHYTTYFDTVELNVTFYRLPQESAFRGWYRRSPRDFAFTVKGSRFITHIKRLKDCKDALILLKRRLRHLKDKLSSVLWQLPPRMKADADRLQKFVKQAATLTTRHIFEFRHESWFQKDVYAVLGRYNCAVCQADWPLSGVTPEATADFLYLRRHGAQKVVYGGCYSEALLKKDAQAIKKWLEQGRDVYVYFNNDARGYAVKNAMRLQKLVGSR